MIDYFPQYLLLIYFINSVRSINTLNSNHSIDLYSHRNLLDSSILKDINFDWKAYLKYNNDLTMLKTEAEALNHFINHGRKEGRRYSKRMPGMENFDWRSYLELNNDIANNGINTENQAFDHYYHHGRFEGRHNFKIVPKTSSYNDARDKLLDYIDGLKTNNVAYKKTNLAIYHIEDVEFSSNSLDVTMNNAKVFASTVNNDDYNDRNKPKMFYWINVAGVSKNPLAFNFKESSNVAIVEWTIAAEDMNSHLETLNLLGYDITMQFSALFFFSTGVRGPFQLRENLQWVEEYRAILDNDNIGLVGATITCTGQIAHVQTHFFVLRGDLVKDILIDLNTKYENLPQWVSLANYYELALTTITKNAGYNIASMIHFKNLNETVFHLETGCANNSEARGKTKLDTNKWCKPKLNDVNFLRWSGESLGAQRFLCNKAIAMNEDSIMEMQNAMTKIVKEVGLVKKYPKSLIKYDKSRIDSDFVLSEAITGGILHDLYKSYSEDMWLDQSDKRNTTYSSTNVCFIVGTLKSHDNKQQAASKYSSLRSDIDIFIKSITRQSNPNWKVFFYPIDRLSFSKRFRDIINELEDNRFSLIEVLNKHINFRIKPSEVFKVITSKVLEIVQNDSACTWLTITNADNAYGSDVVRRVINGRKAKISIDYTMKSSKYQYYDLVLTPFDSKDYAHQDYIQRNEFRWDQRCLDVEAMLQHNLVAYTAQPVPYPGRVDLAAMFFYRDKFVEDGISLGNESNPILSPYIKSNFPKCTALNCEDGYLAHYLVRYKQWKYQRLSLDGFKSMVFHGPSPTLCVASGNVWFDYPSPNQVSCLSHKTIELLQERDKSGRAKVAAFDWKTFFEGDRLCLRLSEAGFVSQLKSIRKAEVTGQKGMTMIDKKSKRNSQNTNSNSRHLASSTKSLTQLPFGFDWRTYLKLNSDLISAGLITKKLAVEHYLSSGFRENRPYIEQFSSDKFFWKDYLELNKDIPIDLQNEQGALQHYKTYGLTELRPSLQLKPITESFQILMEKINEFINMLNQRNIPLNKRSIVIYHLEDKLSNMKSIDIYFNNLNIFLSSINEQNEDTPVTDQFVFYIFNTVKDDIIELPLNYSNVGNLIWMYNAPELYLNLLTMKLLSTEEIIYKSFSVFFFTSSNTRGPLQQQDTINAHWISKYRSILDINDVGLIGPTISCQQAPHVQTYFFGIRTQVIPYIIDEMKEYRDSPSWKSFANYFEIELSAVVIRAGYNIASIATNVKMNQHFFKDTCTSLVAHFSVPSSYISDYDHWCNLDPKQVIFMRWDGSAEYMKDIPADGFLCGRFTNMINDKVNNIMQDTLLELLNNNKYNNKKLGLILPESLRGGITYDLGKQYAQEQWHDKVYSALVVKNKMKTSQHNPIVNRYTPTSSNSATTSSTSSISSSIAGGKVCFLVRTASVHDNIQSENAKYSYDEMGILDFIQSLLRQTNANWLAYFFITDPIPFENRLNRILSDFNDSRLQYFELNLEDRPPFTRADAGYTSTDRVLSHLRLRKDCSWLSVTNADNVYGSGIVSSVLQSERNHIGKQYDLLLAPLDSRNFAQHDYRKRNEGAINERCVGLNAMIKHNLLGFTIQPIPMLGKVDLAAVFLNRKKFYETNLYFGNFTHPVKYPCIGCQDGYLTQHLVRIKRWTYMRLPIDGLKSIIFHGPSPTLCIASNKVWFDFPHVNKVGCFNHDVVYHIESFDDINNPKFDWNYFYQNNRQCLRLIKFGTYDKSTGKVT